MSNLLNKKALSSTVTTVLLISLSIAAIVILAVFIKQLVNQPTLSPDNSCLGFQISSQIKILNACYNSSTQEVQVKISRSLDERAISSLDFTIQGESTHQWSCSQTQTCGICTILQKGETKTYYLSSNNAKNSKILVQANNCLIDSTTIKDIC